MKKKRRPLKRFRKSPLPTPEEIEKRAAEIRKGWDPKTLLRRMGANGPIPVTIYKTKDPFLLLRNSLLRKPYQDSD